MFMTSVSGGGCPRSPPEPPRSLTVVPLIQSEVLRRGYGGARGTVWRWVGGIEGQKSGCLGRQAGFGWVAETPETGKGPEPEPSRAPHPSDENPVTIPSERTKNLGVGHKREWWAEAVFRASQRGAGGARHAECCVLAHDDLANLLGWHLRGLLSGILERRGANGTEHG